jgi:hypothetical protein
LEQQAFSMAIYEGDQSTLTTVVMNGTHTSVNAAQLKSMAAAGSVYTFTTSCSHVYKGQHLSFRKGVSYVLDPTLKAALLAEGAPMTLA